MVATSWYLLFGIIMLLIVPIVPKIISLRVRILHFFRLHALADWHERNSKAISVAVRAIFAAVGVVLLYFGITGSA